MDKIINLYHKALTPNYKQNVIHTHTLQYDTIVFNHTLLQNHEDVKNDIINNFSSQIPSN